MKNKSLILIMFVFITGFHGVSQSSGQGMWSQAVGQLRHAIDRGYGCYYCSSARTRFKVEDFIFSDSASAKYVACAETVNYGSFCDRLHKYWVKDSLDQHRNQIFVNKQYTFLAKQNNCKLLK